MATTKKSKKLTQEENPTVAKKEDQTTSDITLVAELVTEEEPQEEEELSVDEMRSELALRDMALIKQDLLSSGYSNYLHSIIVGTSWVPYNRCPKDSIKQMYDSMLARRSSEAMQKTLNEIEIPPIVED